MKMNLKLVVLLACTTTLASAQAPTPAAAGTKDPAAMQILEGFSKATSQMQTAYIETQTHVKSTATGLNQDLTMTMRMWQKNPDKSYMIMQGAGQDVVTISDGKQMMTYFPTKKQYMIRPAPARSAKTSSSPGGFSPQDFAEMNKSVESATLIGSEPVNGQPAKHIRIKTNKTEMDMWVSDSTTAPLPLRMTMNNNTPQVKMDIDSTMKWILNQPIPDTTFNVTPPPGATDLNTAAGAASVKAAMGAMMNQPVPPGGKK